MGRFTLILLGVWATYAFVQSMEVDPQTMFWAALLPTTYLVGMLLLSDQR